jgi:hypothetical protein
MLSKSVAPMANNTILSGQKVLKWMEKILQHVASMEQVQKGVFFYHAKQFLYIIKWSILSQRQRIHLHQAGNCNVVMSLTEISRLKQMDYSQILWR